jgi:16S rRNA processing protein RimM
VAGGGKDASPPSRVLASPDYLVVAYVLGPHGVSGELKCRIVTDFPERFRPGMRVFIGQTPAPRVVREARVVGADVLLRLDGIDDRTAGEQFRGADVLVAQEDAVELPEGQFFWHQVIGLRTEDTSGQPLGTVSAILPTGANEVYVVRGPLGEILVPAIKQVVKLIAPDEGRIVVDPLPGMLPVPDPRGREPRRRRANRHESDPPVRDPAA